VTLEVTAGGTTKQLDAFPVPYSTPVDGLEVELTAFDEANAAASSGKAVLSDVAFIEIPADLMLNAGTLPDDRSRRAYDPDGTLAAPHSHLTPSQTGMVLEPAAEAGAAVFIGSLKDHPGDPYTFYAPYDAHEVPIPAVFVRGSDGAWLHEQLAAGPVQIKLSVEGTQDEVETHNVVGELPGADDDIVIVGSHLDGPWASAVEDGSGIALVLAQAEYWSRVPAADRPHRLVFLLHGGHMSGGAGLHRYIEDHRDDLDRVVLEFHLEHACLEFVPDGSGAMVSAGRPVPRWFFASEIPRLKEALLAALVDEDLRRSMILPPDAIGDQPPTDGGFYANAGVPIVNFLAAPWYLFDEQDTLDKIDQDSLVPLTRATIRVVESTRGVTASAMREV